MGMILDSTARVRKNQKMPKEINGYLKKAFLPRKRRKTRNRKEKKVLASKKLLANGKS